MFPKTMDFNGCCETVPTPGLRMHYHQCTRKVAVIEEDGKKHCKLHSYAERAKKLAKGEAEFKRRVDERKFQTECLVAVMNYAGRNPYLVKFLHDYTFKRALLGDKGAITIMTMLEKAKRMYAISKRVRV